MILPAAAISFLVGMQTVLAWAWGATSLAAARRRRGRRGGLQGSMSGAVSSATSLVRGDLFQRH